MSNATSGPSRSTTWTYAPSAAGYHSPNYGWHNLRAGMFTQARRNGASTGAVRRQTRHTSDAMIDVYDRDWNPLRGSAVLDLGL